MEAIRESAAAQDAPTGADEVEANKEKESDDESDDDSDEDEADDESEDDDSGGVDLLLLSSDFFPFS